MQLTYIGQGGLHIKLNNYHIVVDPFVSPNPLAGHLNVDDLAADYILVTHGHQDHVADVESIATRTGAKIVSNYEIVSYYGAKGFDGHPMNHGGKWNFEFGMVKYVNAIHSSVLPDGTYGGNPGGFVIDSGDKCFYIAGDTALTMDMKLIPMTCRPLDFAVFPIGDNFTMGYDDAVIAADFIQCDTIVGCHYDTFGYIEINHQDALDAFHKAGKKLLLPEIGTPIEL